MTEFDNVRRRRDNSYVFDGPQGPFHAPNEGEFAPLWAELDAWARQHPDRVLPDDRDAVEPEEQDKPMKPDD